MNLAVVAKTLRDSITTIALAALGTVGFVVLFSWAMVNMGQETLKFVSQFPFLRTILEASLGIRVEGEVSVNMLLAVSFTHLVLLALAWATILATVTRVTAGEVERGTADLLLSLPISRLTVAASTTLVWVLAAAILSACAVAGVWIGGMLFAGDEEVHVRRFVPAAANLFTLHLALGGLGHVAAAIVNRRGLAIGMVVTVVLVSVTLNFVEPFVPAIQSVKFLGLLHYFRPVDVVRAQVWPLQNCLVLVGIASVSWTIGTIYFCRKDIPAV